jgi:hypothetical protein
MTNEITKYDDVIDLRDVIARVEELRGERDNFEIPHPDGGTVEAPGEWAGLNPDDAEELAALESLLSECKGAGGDEQWEGDWYPGTLIRDSYFEDYAQELADDIGAINSEARWPNDCIDWQRAARELQMDYSSVEFDGVTYWTR